MNYCIDFYVGCPCLNEVQEITIKYSKGTDFLAFEQEHINQRINIYIDKPQELTETNWNLISTLCGDPSRNFYAKINYNKDLIQSFVEKYKCRFFIEEICSTWEKVYEMLSYGVSDVYIGNDLGFELDKLTPVVHKAGAAIRTFPNVAQSNPGYNPKLYAQFFIRPEDLEFYSQFIDTVEFFGKIEKQHIYYRIYNKLQRWQGNLNDIIIDLNMDIRNESLEGTFPARRFKCNRSCIKGGKCKTCLHLISLADTVYQKGIILLKTKKK